MNLQKSKQQGFTIVELLIVIVVIAILAAISIVAYTGIQNRARDTTVNQAAGQLKTKIEAWNGFKAVYPTPEQVKGGLVDTKVPEAALGDDVKKLIGDNAPESHENGKAIQIVSCTTDSKQTGVQIVFYQTNGGNKKINMGTGCSA